MPKKSAAIKKTKTSKSVFRSEEEEADWYHSPAGRQRAARALRRAVRKGTIVLNEQVPIGEVNAMAANTGKVVLAREGIVTDPAAIQKLLDDVRLTMTKPVSIRLPITSIAKAKRIAKERGIGYQTLMKDIFERWLKSAS